MLDERVIFKAEAGEEPVGFDNLDADGAKDDVWLFVAAWLILQLAAVGGMASIGLPENFEDSPRLVRLATVATPPGIAAALAGWVGCRHRVRLGRAWTVFAITPWMCYAGFTTFALLAVAW